ncbi:uncharacterized protein K460DRAFT_293380 [Cucurbitaria berberidis CBS 394.84]|uniref:Zn(2)-C6 fungal-type domain-containing protein n=1 Tax=Cucurbitaria berberidis CBS 394.84 TaxID=1168544 RepID=A0A9P4GB17_9PLEO|nr:uncharacterized protein K460DRAFT_293380 [Cucurbitaria berberidis CBS 394.84]KAF1842503.1 hypothetical protein K460DRAFT_293380 [Cucurbitaria berberidis CBS 394.84]
MPSIIGPYDGRKARRKRCDSCVRRQIKCHGGRPCENCRRTNQPCGMATRHTGASFVFVGQASDSKTEKTGPALPGAQMVSPLPKSICPKRTDRYLPYFFTSFLPMNLFTGRTIPIREDLLAMSKSSPALKDAIDAVAALHSQRQRQLSFVAQNENVESIQALQAYTRSVRCIQEEIAAGTFMANQSALWVTFLLGLFEVRLMRDSTGTNWLSHFLHGTSTMLRLQRPEALACSDPYSSQRRSFFLATRIFEISRSFIFSSPTFLSTPEWTAALARLWEGEGAALWHPKEALFDMLPQFSDLSIRTIHFCEDADQLPLNARRALIRSLAREGLILQAWLQKWDVDARTWEKVPGHKPDTELMIGHIYYHATSIYHSGTYDYHPHWTCADAPILPRETINWHASEILRLSHELLAQGVASPLLLYPLRVAGARAKDERSRNDILGLLQMTARRGFVVADAFTDELSELWADNDMSSPTEVD